MIDFRKIHFINDGDDMLLFHNPSYSLIDLNKKTGEILVALQKGENTENIAKDFAVSIADIETCLNGLESIFKKNQPQRENSSNDNVVNRITLHISNDCNLRCKYCYANGGNYQMTRHLMTKETAKQFYKFCVENFTHIEKIVFFGGEPCLNIGIMEYVCELFSKYKFDKKLKDAPKFAIITNGTILNDRLLKLIDHHISYITISIDGPKDINDFNRIDKAGNGSYERIERFIAAVKQCSNVLLQYEATYTHYHMEKGMTQDDIATYLNQHFDIRGFVVEELGLEYEDKSIYSFDNIENIPEFIVNIICAITFKKDLQSCQVSRRQFAISPSGDVFPCHMDVGTECLNLGNISGKNIFNSSDIQKDFPLFNLIHDKKLLCPECWAHNLCQGCSRSLFHNEKTKKYGIIPADDKCIYQKDYIERALIAISRLRKNKKKWQNYVENINKINRTYKDC